MSNQRRGLGARYWLILTAIPQWRRYPSSRFSPSPSTTETFCRETTIVIIIRGYKVNLASILKLELAPIPVLDDKYFLVSLSTRIWILLVPDVVHEHDDPDNKGNEETKSQDECQCLEMFCNAEILKITLSYDCNQSEDTYLVRLLLIISLEGPLQSKKVLRLSRLSLELLFK